MYPAKPDRRRRVIIRTVATIVVSATMAAAAMVSGLVLAPPAAAVAGDTHFVTATSTDLYDAVDPASGPFLPVDRISRMTGPIPGASPRISVVTVGNQVHLLATNSTSLLHSIRGNDGTWSAFTSVPIDGVGLIFRVNAVNVGGALHAVLHSGSQVYHAARSARGVWTTFVDIETQAGRLGDFFTTIVDASAAGTILGRLEVVVQTDGRFYHTTRRSNGTWDGWDDVSARTGNPGSFFSSRSMALASVGSDVHMLTIGTDGPFHAIRSPDGSWTRFVRVYDHAQAPTGAGIMRLAATEMSGRLLLAIQSFPSSSEPSQLFYVMRRPDGSWESRFAPFPGPPDVGSRGVDAIAVTQE